MAELAYYLFGPGRREEHVDPHFYRVGQACQAAKDPTGYPGPLRAT